MYMGKFNIFRLYKKKEEFITELDTEILNNHLEIQKIIINNMAKDHQGKI